MHVAILILLLSTSPCAFAKSGVPVFMPCGPVNSKIGCIDRYASVLPNPFFREALSGRVGIDPIDDTFKSTNVSSDPSFANVATSDFLVFDKARGLDVLGSNPSIDFMFATPNVNHEAPVYVPSQD